MSSSPFASRRFALASAILLALSANAAHADEPLCLDAYGQVVVPAPSTDQGIEGGVDNATCHVNGIAIGRNNVTNWGYAFGAANRALGFRSSAFGSANWAYGSDSLAVGRTNAAMGRSSVAVGTYTTALGSGSVAVGSWFDRNNDGIQNFDIDLDGDGVADSTSEGTFARGTYATALGAGADAAADNAVAIGSGAFANRGNAVSFGHAGLQRQLTNVADATEATDAVNLRQLQAAISGSGADLSPFAAAFGGGASWNGSLFTPPSYTVQGVSYGNVGAALAAIDQWMTGNAHGVQYDDPSHATVTLDGADGTRIGNLADGIDPDDAVNKRQMDAGDQMTLAAAKKAAEIGDDATLAAAKAHANAGDATTLTASKAYTDTTATQTLNSAKTYTDAKFAAWTDTFTQYQRQVDLRFAQTDKRIDQVGAMGSAMTQMAVNAANGNSAKGRVAIGIGAQGSQGALSIGYGKRLGDRGSFSLGASFSNGESSVGGGFGFDL